MDIDFINAALIAMGLDPMADPARATGRVQKSAVQVHLRVRGEVLEANNWTANDKVARLEPEADGIVPPGFAYVAALPADYVGMWDTSADTFSVVLVGEGESARRRVAWCGDSVITIRYSASIPYALMNPLLQRAALDKLAAALQPVSTEKVSDRKVQEDLAVASEMRAAARDALNRRKDPLFAGQWDGANVGGPSYGDPRGGTW